mgnify:CR=1 FL=1
MAVEEILTPDVPDDTVVAPVVAPDAGQLPSVAPDGRLPALGEFTGLPNP